jgi:hypothetical protein
MKDLMKVSPFKILEKSTRGALGRGNLGVLIARAGVGKTSCLIHLAFDKLLRQEKVLHVCLEDSPEKVAFYYDVIFYELVKALEMEEEEQLKSKLEKNRMILAYLNQSFEIGRLRTNIKNLIEKIAFIPEAIIIDGLDFLKVGREVIKDFKEMAHEFQVEIWFSALTLSDGEDVPGKGVPYLTNRIEELFSMVIQLSPAQQEISIRLVKDHEAEVAPDIMVRLDPKTFLPLA